MKTLSELTDQSTEITIFKRKKIKKDRLVWSERILFMTWSKSNRSTSMDKYGRTGARVWRRIGLTIRTIRISRCIMKGCKTWLRRRSKLRTVQSNLKSKKCVYLKNCKRRPLDNKKQRSLSEKLINKVLLEVIKLQDHNQWR